MIRAATIREYILGFNAQPVLKLAELRRSQSRARVVPATAMTKPFAMVSWESYGDIEYQQAVLVQLPLFRGRPREVVSR
jgi:hypothetical protein